ncbi:hypothetical protein DIPPA_34483 [Diplonema papillatum]|nr:hypothetical protein DIPPA_34483 [Diplonema papillatum]
MQGLVEPRMLLEDTSSASVIAKAMRIINGEVDGVYPAPGCTPTCSPNAWLGTSGGGGVRQSPSPSGSLLLGSPSSRRPSASPMIASLLSKPAGSVDRASVSPTASSIHRSGSSLRTPMPASLQLSSQNLRVGLPQFPSTADASNAALQSVTSPATTSGSPHPTSLGSASTNGCPPTNCNSFDAPLLASSFATTPRASPLASHAPALAAAAGDARPFPAKAGTALPPSKQRVVTDVRRCASFTLAGARSPTSPGGGGGGGDNLSAVDLGASSNSWSHPLGSQSGRLWQTLPARREPAGLVVKMPQPERFDIRAFRTVRDLKLAVQEKTRVCAKRQEISLGSRVLSDAEELAGIEHDALLRQPAHSRSPPEICLSMREIPEAYTDCTDYPAPSPHGCLSQYTLAYEGIRRTSSNLSEMDDAHAPYSHGGSVNMNDSLASRPSPKAAFGAAFTVASPGSPLGPTPNVNALCRPAPWGGGKAPPPAPPGRCSLVARAPKWVPPTAAKPAAGRRQSGGSDAHSAPSACGLPPGHAAAGSDRSDETSEGDLSAANPSENSTPRYDAAAAAAAEAGVKPAKPSLRQKGAAARRRAGSKVAIGTVESITICADGSTTTTAGLAGKGGGVSAPEGAELVQRQPAADRAVSVRTQSGDRLAATPAERSAAKAMIHDTFLKESDSAAKPPSVWDGSVVSNEECTESDFGCISTVGEAPAYQLIDMDKAAGDWRSVRVELRSDWPRASFTTSHFDDKSVYCACVADAVRVYHLNKESQAYESVAFVSPRAVAADEEYLVIGGKQTLLCYDMKQKGVVWSVKTDLYQTLAAGGGHLVVGGRDGELWYQQTSARFETRTLLAGSGKAVRPWRSVSVDQNFVVAVSQDNALFVWSTDRATPGVLIGARPAQDDLHHHSAVLCAGSICIHMSENTWNHVSICDPRTGKVRATWKRESQSPVSVSVIGNPDDMIVAVANAVNVQFTRLTMTTLENLHDLFVPSKDAGRSKKLLFAGSNHLISVHEDAVLSWSSGPRPDETKAPKKRNEKCCVM